MYKMKRSGKTTGLSSWMGGWQVAVNNLIARGMTKDEAKKLLRARKKNMEKMMKAQDDR